MDRYLDGSSIFSFSQISYVHSQFPFPSNDEITSHELYKQKVEKTRYNMIYWRALGSVQIVELNQNDIVQRI